MLTASRLLTNVPCTFPLPQFYCMVKKEPVVFVAKSVYVHCICYNYTTSLNTHMPIDYGYENRVHHYENAIEVFSRTQ